jgi:PAS domain S-box-containing protein
MKYPVKILFLEDVFLDAELIWKEIVKSNISFEKILVQTKSDYVNALNAFKPDLIISDYSLPQFDGMSALIIKNELTPATPFILVTGSVNEEIAVELMKMGADDYLLKQNLSRLGSSIRTAIAKKEIILQKEFAEKELIESERLFSAFTEHCPVYFFFKDNKGTPVRLSHNYEKMLGRPAKDAIGKSMYELFPEELARSMIEDDIRVLKNNVPVKVVEEFNGRIFETIKFPIQMPGTPPYLAGFTQDITAQKESEEELKKNIEEMEQMIELTVGRELKMVELKKEINELLARLGEGEKYKIVE